MDVDEVPSIGLYYIWCSLIDDGVKIYSKFDRVFANDAWYSSSRNES